MPTIHAHTKSTKDTVDVGTLTANPFNFPSNYGNTF